MNCYSGLRVWLETGHFVLRLDARSHNSLNCPESVLRASQRLSSQRLSQSNPPQPPMEALSATSAIAGLAVPVFQCAKALRDRIKLVCYLHRPLRTLRTLMNILYPRFQVASEKAELLAALTEYEKDINLLELLYNNNKELLDQQNLDTDVKELAEHARSYFLFAAVV